MTDDARPLGLADMGEGGWALGPGPDQWMVYVDWRPGTPAQRPGLHLICQQCGQSVARLGRWSFNLAGLKPQIALHVMQVHSGALTG